MIRGWVLAALALGALVVGLPWIAYGVGLANLDGRPMRAPIRKLDAEQQEFLHVAMRKAGVLDVPQLTPWDYALDTIRDPDKLASGGFEAATIVAQNYARSHVRYKGPHAERLSETALAVWLTQSWSTDEILATAYEIVSKRGLRLGR
jgi:hypothetical protein